MLKILGGEYRGRKLLTVPGDTTRPTAARVREALFSIVGPRQRVLDCFAGTGAIALEALSRGARLAVAIDENPRAVRIIQDNARLLGLTDRLTVIRSAVPGALDTLPLGDFDLVFADPPYAFGEWELLLEGLSRRAAAHGAVVVEHAADRSIPPFAALNLVRVYRYGGTALTVYRALSPRACPEL